MKNSDSLRSDQENWFNENYLFGRSLGYPECCVTEFCLQSPLYLKYNKATKWDKLRYDMSFVNKKYSGFIPCIKHAMEIRDKKITLESLIKNRSKDFKDFLLSF